MGTGSKVTSSQHWAPSIDKHLLRAGLHADVCVQKV